MPRIYEIGKALFCRGKAAFSGALEALFDGGACRLDQDDDDQHEALECILDVDTKARNRNDNEVDRCIGKCTENDAEHPAAWQQVQMHPFLLSRHLSV